MNEAERVFFFPVGLSPRFFFLLLFFHEPPLKETFCLSFHISSFFSSFFLLLLLLLADIFLPLLSFLFSCSDKETSTTGIHQMRLLHRHSLYHCLGCYLMTFDTQKRPYWSFGNNTGRTYGQTDGPMDSRTRRLVEMRSRI